MQLQVDDPTLESTPEGRAQLLAKVDLFCCLDPVSLLQLAERMTSVATPTGTVVLRQGEAGDGVYVVSRGSYGVYVVPPTSSDEARVAAIGSGELIGEMELFSDQANKATVRADEDGELLQMDRAVFMALLNEKPVVGQRIMSAFSHRLRAADETLAQLTEAALLMAENRLTRECAVCLETAVGIDNVSRLSQVFGRMAQEVLAREEQLRQEVQQLQIQIDQAKAERSAAEITETDYFRSLQQRSKRLRSRYR